MHFSVQGLNSAFVPKEIPMCFCLAITANYSKYSAVFHLFLKQNLLFASANLSLQCDHKIDCVC